MKTEREGERMRFIINDLVYDTDKMEEIATVRKWVKKYHGIRHIRERDWKADAAHLMEEQRRKIPFDP